MAATLNKVMLIGRLGRDPELRYASNGTPVVNMRIATDESYTDKSGNRVDKAEWHSVVVWDRQAENCNNYLSKGSLIFVEGSLQTRQWQDQQGQNRYTTEIRAQRIQFLDTRRSQGMDDGYGGSQQPRQQGRPAPQQGGYNNGPQMNDRQAPPDDDLGPAFPSEASGMDEVPF